MSSQNFTTKTKNYDKMIKEDNLGYTNKLHLTLHKVDSLYLENSESGDKVVSFIEERIRNKEEKSRE